MISLLELMQQKLREQIPSDNPNIPIDERFSQTSMIFPDEPIIKFVTDRSLTLARQYCDLPRIKLSQNERDIVRQKSDGIEKQSKNNPKIYNGNHLLVTNVIYDPVENTLYVEVKQAKYSLVASLSDFPQNSPLFSRYPILCKTGVMVPTYLDNAFTEIYLLQRAHPNQLYQFFSVPSGFLEVTNPKMHLNNAFNKCKNFVSYTACKELFEELLDKSGVYPEKFPAIRGLSVRWTTMPDGRITHSTVEFIAPTPLRATPSLMDTVFNNPTAPDNHEHIQGVYKRLSFDSQQHNEDPRAFIKESIRTGYPTGKFLFIPSLLATIAAINDGNGRYPLPSGIPNSRYSLFSSRQLTINPSRPIPCIIENPDGEFLPHSCNR